MKIIVKTCSNEETLRFAINGGRLVHVDEVDTGLDCGCLCPNPDCREPLVAKNRRFNERVQVTYFAHQTKGNCPGARESALHLLAKQIVKEDGRLWMPAVPLLETGASPWHLLFAAGVVSLTDVALEQPLEGFVPDITAKANGETILVEICVTHKIEEQKFNAVHQRGWTMLEIYLSDLLHTDFTCETVRSRLLGASAQAKWIRHEGVIAKRAAIHLQSEMLQAEVDDCPAGLGLVKSFHLADGALGWGYHHNDAPCDRCPCRISQVAKDGSGDRNRIYCVGKELLDSIPAFDRFQQGETRSQAPRWLLRFRQERAVREAERYLEADQYRLRRAAEDLNEAFKRAKEAVDAKADRDWLIPFCEIGPGEKKVELMPTPGLRRLRPLPHKRPLRPECAKTISQRLASNLGLYWDPSINNWIFYSSGSFSDTKQGTPRPTVPKPIREFIDLNSIWTPVFPAEQRSLSAIRE